jgi:hypothetical protein
MKRLLLAFFLFGAAVRAEAADYTDIWFNASQPGYGFNIVESDDGSGFPFLFVTFFIYGPTGAPTWYTAQLTWNGVDAFAGNVYATAGTFFGVPWNAANLSVLQAGTASFKPNPNNNYQGTLSYMVTGVGSSTTPLTRQTLTSIATSGTYVGGQSGSFSGCNAAADNGAYKDYYDLQVAQGAGGNVTYAFTFKSGLTCQFTGTYLQNGQYFSVPNAAYTCSDGTLTTAQMSEIKATSLGLEGRFIAPGGLDNCTESAFFGGPVVH